MAKQLPIPKDPYGRVEWGTDEGFEVYLGNTTKDDFNDYVDACYNKGFNLDSHRSDKYYYANNSKGYQVHVEYEGNNVMSVSIKKQQ